MKVSSFKCRAALILEEHKVQWFEEGRLRVSKKTKRRWGTCKACGRHHYEAREEERG